MDNVQPVEVVVGDHAVLFKDGTIVDGLISGWMVAGGEVIHLFIENCEQPFKLVGDDSWKFLREDEEDGEV